MIALTRFLSVTRGFQPLSEAASVYQFFFYAFDKLLFVSGYRVSCTLKTLSSGFKFNAEEEAKVNEAKKIQKWVSTLFSVSSMLA